jgi:hypothetical protein
MDGVLFYQVVTKLETSWRYLVGRAVTRDAPDVSAREHQRKNAMYLALASNLPAPA